MEFVELDEIVRGFLAAARKCHESALFDLSYCENEEPGLSEIERRL
ncbi:MAG: hypothetical protein GY720_23180 [bacterium]|nr:hypothetical protein [bacterium]